jgi:hypothetical protein
MLWLKLAVMYFFFIPLWGSIAYFVASSMAIIFFTGNRWLTRVAIEGLGVLTLLCLTFGVVCLPDNPFLTKWFAADLRNLELSRRWIVNLIGILISSIFLLAIRQKSLRAWKDEYRT